MRRTCNTQGCNAKAWHGERCNFHALQAHYRNQAEQIVLPEEVEQAQASTHSAAAEIGLELANAVVPEESPARATATAGVAQPSRNGRRVRSPVG
ncbi:MAG: hypothetical protein V3T05_12020 [Myxococcota bacterium]